MCRICINAWCSCNKGIWIGASQCKQSHWSIWFATLMRQVELYSYISRYLFNIQHIQRQYICFSPRSHCRFCAVLCNGCQEHNSLVTKYWCPSSPAHLSYAGCCNCTKCWEFPLEYRMISLWLFCCKRLCHEQAIHLSMPRMLGNYDVSKYTSDAVLTHIAWTQNDTSFLIAWTA